MNSKLIAAAVFAVAGLGSVNSFAATVDGGIDSPQFNTASTESREQVRAAAQNIQFSPVISSSQVDGSSAVVAASVASERSRAEVRAEAVQVRASTPVEAVTSGA